MSETRFERIRCETAGPGAWITVDRPEKLNALDRLTLEEVAAAVDRAVAAPDVRAIVLTGAGDKAFAAGADIAEMSALDAAEAQRFSHFLHASLARIERSPKPVIAAVNGFALGGGCELALACHLRIAAEHARFGQPEVGLGLIAGAGGTQRLPRLVGRGRALELLLGGDMIDAAEAFRIGLVNRVVPASDLRSTAEEWVERLARRAPLALARTIEAAVSGEELALPEALRFESAQFALCFATDDMREGTRAFLEKRKPGFKGR